MIIQLINQVIFTDTSMVKNLSCTQRVIFLKENVDLDFQKKLAFSRKDDF